MDLLDTMIGLGAMSGIISLALVIHDRWNSRRPSFHVAFDRSRSHKSPKLVGVNPGNQQVIVEVPPRRQGETYILPNTDIVWLVRGAQHKETLAFPLDPNQRKEFAIILGEKYDDWTDDYLIEIRFRWRFLHARPYCWRRERFVFTKLQFEQARARDIVQPGR